jgi:hypothetical protein
MLIADSQDPGDLRDRGIFLGYLIVAPSDRVGSLRLKRLHPRFDLGETAYLKKLALKRMWETVERRLQETDEVNNLTEERREEMEHEITGFKDLLETYRYDDAADEVDKISDMADIVLTRLMERPKVRVLEVIQIEG